MFFFNVTELNRTAIILQLKAEVILERVDIFCRKNRSNLILCGQRNGTLKGTVVIDTSPEYKQEYAPNVLLYYEVKTDYVIIMGTIQTTGQG